ncbi:RNA polymerase sigma factor SigJ [Actinocatenispora rupis]|uniref:DNA-directed RNA polymerase sigma-70 factor n=1 Tax=Actinocatenispora rupis TaxID=519421 RepID=A0A8J3JGK7_9ACTN|nr:RNA polymerase sigma factor SigJ [Actinocatenispora rupis]GID14493.1 DNA-directed RNA polymerase sigma-70 factor [Actinocatenispora rupis]
MTENEFLAEQFEQQRGHLRAVAYRMLGSLTEADDAVQEAWLRVSRAGTDEVRNLGGWLTTVVARVALNMLRSRRTRGEQPLDTHVPDPVVSREDRVDPEQQALLADSVGLALLVVLDTLAPAERLAFVLHDMFGVPFEEIADVLDRSPASARQLASRARRRVQGQPVAPDPDVVRQKQVVDAFLAASQAGDFDALVAVLHPDVVLRADGGLSRPQLSKELHGADAVAGSALMFRRTATEGVHRRVLVNGAVGTMSWVDGRPTSLLAFTVVDDRITAITILADPDRLAGLDLTVLDD